MKKYRAEIIMIASFLAVCVLMILLDGTHFRILEDEKADGLLQETISRFAGIAFFIPLTLFAGEKQSFLGRTKRPFRALLWCLPCLLVCLANFPFSALIRGDAVITRWDLLWLFLLKCLSIGLMEEIIFRALMQPMILDSFKKRGELFGVLLTSALFGAWHLLNLFGGANVGATFLQVGYSFLMGMMLSAVVIKTGNVWTSVFLHALFDFGGLIVPALGNGAFQDTVFWALTAIAGALCALHVGIFFIAREGKRRALKRAETAPSSAPEPPDQKNDRISKMNTK